MERFGLRKLLIIALFVFCGRSAHAQAFTCTNSVHCVQVSWTASSTAAANPTLGYKVYRLNAVCPATGPATTAAALIAGWQVISGTTPLTGLVYVDNGFPATPLPEGVYCYFVSAILNVTESLPSNTLLAAVLPGSVVISIAIK